MQLRVLALDFDGTITRGDDRRPPRLRLHPERPSSGPKLLHIVLRHYDGSMVSIEIVGGVILSAAKDLLAGIERRKMILRCAQDDKFRSLRNWGFIKSVGRFPVPLSEF